MYVTMLADRQAAPDGLHVVLLREGETHDLPDELAEKYVARGLATAAEPPIDEPDEVDEKADDPVEENKAADPVEENKAEQQPATPKPRARRGATKKA